MWVPTNNKSDAGPPVMVKIKFNTMYEIEPYIQTPIAFMQERLKQWLWKGRRYFFFFFFLSFLGPLPRIWSFPG